MPLSVTNFDTLRHVTITTLPQQDMGGRKFVKVELKARENTSILTVSPEQAEILIDRLSDCLDLIEAKEAK